jgi:hypothetical protein
MTNVYQFPKSKIVRDVPQDMEEVEKIRTKGKKNYADGMAEELTVIVLTEMENFGMETTHPGFQKDFIFLNDVIKCAIYRSMGLSHGLHEFIDEHVEVVNMAEADLLEEDIDTETDK